MHYYLSFDIGGTGLKHGVIDEDGNLLTKGQTPTPNSLAGLLETMKTIADDYRATYQFKACGISIPGAVNNKTGFIGGVTALHYIHQFNIRAQFEETLQLPVAMANDANCAALAEGWIGAAKEVNSYASVVIGTGIGGAVVQDRKLVTGSHQHGGEFGYWILELNSGTNWSDLGATRILIERVAHALGRDTIDGREIFRLVDEGHELVIPIVEWFYRINAIGIYNIQHALDPELILVGGGISQEPKVIDGINRHLKIILSKARNMEIEVKACQFLNDANLIGAVYNYRLENAE